jgi:hypothetical protein
MTFNWDETHFIHSIRHAITHIFIQKQISASCTSYGRVTKERRRREKELSTVGPHGPSIKRSPEPPMEEESKYDASSPSPDHVANSDVHVNNVKSSKSAPESYQSIYPLVSLKSIQHIISLNPRGEKPVRAFTMEWLLTVCLLDFFFSSQLWRFERKVQCGQNQQMLDWKE